MQLWKAVEPALLRHGAARLLNCEPDGAAGATISFTQLLERVSVLCRWLLHACSTGQQVHPQIQRVKQGIQRGWTVGLLLEHPSVDYITASMACMAAG